MTRCSSADWLPLSSAPCCLMVFPSDILYKYSLVGIFLEIQGISLDPVPAVYVVYFLKLYPKGAPRSIKKNQDHPGASCLWSSFPVCQAEMNGCRSPAKQHC